MPSAEFMERKKEFDAEVGRIREAFLYGDYGTVRRELSLAHGSIAAALAVAVFDQLTHTARPNFLRLLVSWRLDLHPSAK